MKVAKFVFIGIFAALSAAGTLVMPAADTLATGGHYGQSSKESKDSDKKYTHKSEHKSDQTGHDKKRSESAKMVEDSDNKHKDDHKKHNKADKPEKGEKSDKKDQKPKAKEDKKSDKDNHKHDKKDKRDKKEDCKTETVVDDKKDSTPKPEVKTADQPKGAGNVVVTDAAAYTDEPRVAALPATGGVSTSLIPIAGMIAAAVAYLSAPVLHRFGAKA